MQDIALSSWRELVRSSWEGSKRRAGGMPTCVVLTPASFVGMLLEFTHGDVQRARELVPQEAPGDGYWREVHARLTFIEEVEAVPSRVRDAHR